MKKNKEHIKNMCFYSACFKQKWIKWWNMQQWKEIVQ